MKTNTRRALAAITLAATTILSSAIASNAANVWGWGGK